MAGFRQGQVFYNNNLAGYISETDEGYIFEYDKEFLVKNTPISISLPLRNEFYKSRDLFPFFKGLLPEGWYLDIVAAVQKVDREDSFGLLLCTTNLDTIGAVTVKKTEKS